MQIMSQDVPAAADNRVPSSKKSAGHDHRSTQAASIDPPVSDSDMVPIRKHISILVVADNDRHRVTLQGTIAQISHATIDVATDDMATLILKEADTFVLYLMDEHIHARFLGRNAAGKLRFQIERLTRRKAELISAVMISGDASLNYRSITKMFGFAPKLERFVRFRSATPSELDAIRRLRVLAYRRAGKQSNLEPLSDLGDTGAIVVAGWIGQRLVCSYRLRFLGRGDWFDHEYHGVASDSALPPRTRCTEMGRLCVDPALQGSDLALTMFCDGVHRIRRYPRRYLVACASGGALRSYIRLGGRLTGHSFFYRPDSKAPHHVFIADLVRAAVGADLPFLALATFWEPTLTLSRCRKIHLSWRLRARNGAIRQVARIVAWIGHVQSRLPVRLSNHSGKITATASPFGQSVCRAAGHFVEADSRLDYEPLQSNGTFDDLNTNQRN